LCPWAQWFDDLGGWTQRGNIDLFLAYVVRAVGLFGDQVTKWATFNEPVVSQG
jgi:6-phospho-beta-glucosidase